MADRNGASLFGRVALLLLTVYALAMIAPDLLRVVRPLGSFGLAMDGDGRIYDVQGPFESEEDSPAWRAGLRVGDRLDLAAMSLRARRHHCVRKPAVAMGRRDLRHAWTRGDALRRLGGGTPGARSQAHRRATARQSPARPRRCARHDRRDPGCARRGLAGVDAPGPMTWGFFVYVIQFNPGQAFQFWAWLQLWPRALLAQNVIFLVMQAAAYTGLLMFALRAPVDRTEGPMADHRARAAGSGDRVLGRRARQHGDRLRLSRRNLGAEHAVHRLCGQRRRARDPYRASAGSLAPRLSAHPLGDLGLPDRPSGLFACPALPGNLAVRRLARTRVRRRRKSPAPSSSSTAILCLFVVEAVRRPTVVNVWIPLRRATAFGLLLSVPVLFLHKQIETIDEYIHMPDWAWVVVASGLVYLIARGHEFATELMDRLFDRKFIRAERHLAEVGETIQQCRQPRRDRAPVGERADAYAGPGVGGAVSRAGRRLLPKRQRRMGP